MCRAERVVFAFRPLGETRKSSALAHGAHAVAAAGQDLVRIGLMADIPDHAVGRRVEHVMQRNRQFDHTEAGAEMAAGDGYDVDQLVAQFLGDCAHLALVELAQIDRLADRVQQRKFSLHRLQTHGLSKLYSSARTIGFTIRD